VLRKEQRRLERRQFLGKRLLAGSTAIVIALGMAVGGTAPVFAAPASTTLSAPIVNANGIKTYFQKGLTCNEQAVNFQKPPALDGSNLNNDGLYQAVNPNNWGTLTWDVSDKRVTWSINPGWDVDVCVKGGSYLTTIDTSNTPAGVTSYVHTYAGLSHLGFRIVSAPSGTPTQVVDCVSVTYSKGAPISNGDHFNITITPPGSQINAYVDQNIAGGVNYNGQNGLGLRINAFGVAQTPIPLTLPQVTSGVLVFFYSEFITAASWTVSFVQTDAIDTWPNLKCGTTETEQLLEPLATSAEIECNTDGSYTLGDLMVDGVQAVQWYVAIGDTKPTDLSGYKQFDPGKVIVNSTQTVHVKAVPISDKYSLKPGATSEWTFRFTAPEGCARPCLPNDAITYTYVNSGPTANTGIVTVAQRDGYSDKLCKPLYVTAAAWAFNVVDQVWTQTLVVANRINGGEPITQVGTYEYGALVGCGQGDIYASRTAFPNPSPLLLGPNQPAWPEGMTPWDFEETFLHDMGFSGTPGPTYLVTNPGCNALIPVTPTVSVIDECGEYGAIKLNSDNPHISYIVKDTNGIVVPVADAKEGQFTVVAIASFPYILKNYPVGGWPVNLQKKYDCELPDLPITDASIGFVDPTCNYNQKLDPSKLVVTDALLATRESYQEFSDGRYEVVFVTTDPLARFFDSSTPVPGRTVSEGGTKLTFTGTLAGPNTELCTVLSVVDPFAYVDTCVTASFTLFSVEGLTYRVTIGNDPSFDAVFAEGVPSKTFAVEPGDYVLAVPRANDGYILGPDQPTPLDRQFTTYGPDDCQLPELPNWPASATATNQVCSVFGMNSGTIAVQFSVGPVSNPNPVRYYLAYGTAQQQELTSAVTAVPPGQHLVTAVASISTDSVNDAGNTAVLPVTAGAASAENCDLPTLAFTGASGALTGMGALALLLTLVGAGVVVARRRQA